MWQSDVIEKYFSLVVSFQNDVNEKISKHNSLLKYKQGTKISIFELHIHRCTISVLIHDACILKLKYLCKNKFVTRNNLWLTALAYLKWQSRIVRIYISSGGLDTTQGC